MPGKIVESGPTNAIINDPEHPYTQGLLKALPGSIQPGTRLNQIPGMMPTLTDIPPGCAFHPRCAFAEALCKTEVPVLIRLDDQNRMAACHMIAAKLGLSSYGVKTGDEEPITETFSGKIP